MRKFKGQGYDNVLLGQNYRTSQGMTMDGYRATAERRLAENPRTSGTMNPHVNSPANEPEFRQREPSASLPDLWHGQIIWK
jgi:hypothetical protein